MKKILVSMAVMLAASAAFAQTNGTITNGTQSQAEQSVGVNNSVNLGGSPEVTYHGSYTVKQAPTVYAPSLTASISETCWGSVSGSVSVVGVGVAGGATVRDNDCNRRLNAAVAWRMDRKDIAFLLMCQEDDFRAAAALTDKTCDVPVVKKASNDLITKPALAMTLDQRPQPTDPFVRARLGLPPLPNKQ